MANYFILKETYSYAYCITDNLTLVKELDGIENVEVVGVCGEDNVRHLGNKYRVDLSLFETITPAEYKAKFADATLLPEIERELGNGDSHSQAEAKYSDDVIYDVDEMEECLDHFGYDNYLRTSYKYPYLDLIANECWRNKAKLRNILRKHPNWDEKQQAVVFHSTIETGINAQGISQFANFILTHFRRKFIEEHIDVEFGNLVNERNAYEEAITALHRAKEMLSSSTLFDPDSVMVNYMTYDKINAKYEQLSKEYYNKCNDYCFKVMDSHEGYLKIEDSTFYDNVIDFFSSLESEIISSNMTEEFADTVNKLFPEVKAVVGQKTSRVINKICKLLELDGIKDIRENHNGEAKDYGYNYYFALLGDSINPLKISKYTVISINLFDYWTASRGTNWSSCHSIDIFHEDADWSNYDGCYSSGTESYMLDGSSVVMYTVDENYDGPMRRARKDRRMMAHISEDGKTFVFGRLYPDGRDGGEKGMASQFRNILQKVLSECNSEANYWTTVKGTENNRSIVIDSCEGTNYRDYFSYNDTGYSYVKGTEPVKIKIGHAPICPQCGNRHDRSNNIFCEDCMRSDGEDPEEGDYIGECYECGDSIYEDNDEYIYCEDNGRYYCCPRCAERAGLIYCDDDYNYHTEDCCFYDEGKGFYYSGEPEIETDDGYYYSDEEDAIHDGYHCNGDGIWTKEDDEEDAV